MSQTILLVRHGQTASNAGGILQGHLQIPLNDVGLRQARDIAARLGKWEPRIEALVSSDLSRAYQTAEPISAATGLSIVSDPAWRERGLGELEGKSVGEKETWRIASGDVEVPGAETMAGFAGRIERAIDHTLERFPNAKTIAVVTHGGVLRMVLRFLNSGVLPMSAGQTPPDLVMIANASLMEIRKSADGWTLVRVNDVAHLEQVTTKGAG